VTAAKLLPAAQAEIRAEAHYLEDKREGLGDRFLDAVDATLRAIEALPRTGSTVVPFVHGDHRIRAKKVGRFRIRLIYLDSVPPLVVAAKHDRQHPDYWKTRLH